MGSVSSSLDESPVRADFMVKPESPTKDNSVFPMTVKPEKNDGVSIISANKILESSRKSNSIPVVSPMTANNNLTPVKSRWSFSSSKKSYGSKDETFFDSQQWLQSDSDDDFHSVNGDFTPSLGNTPKSSFSDKPRRKKLGELFRESIREESSSSTISTPYISGEFNNVDIEVTSVKEDKKKSNLHRHNTCLPGFTSCGRSFMERRKKMNSVTAVAAAVK